MIVMDKTTLGVYGWILVALLCMGSLLVFATPFGKYTMNEVNYIIEELCDSAFADPDAEQYTLAEPNLAINNSTLTITPVDGADSYEFYIGNRYVMTVTDNLVINLNEHINVTGIFVLKVVATNSAGEISDTATIGYNLQ
jgi:hypothetical protein